MRRHGQLRISLECHDTIPAGQRCTYWSFCLWLAWTSEFLKRFESGQVGWNCFHVLILHVVSRRFDIFWRLHNICVYHLLYRKTVMFATQLLLIVLAWSLIACYWEWPEWCFGGLKAWHECLHFLCHRIRNAILCHTAPMLYWWKAESEVLTLRVWTWLSKILRLWRVNTWNTLNIAAGGLF